MEKKDNVKTYNYKNAYGYMKQLVVFLDNVEDGKYLANLWCLNNGEFCGSGRLSKEEIQDWLVHYNIADTFME